MRNTILLWEYIPAQEVLNLVQPYGQQGVIRQFEDHYEITYPTPIEAARVAGNLIYSGYAAYLGNPIGNSKVIAKLTLTTSASPQEVLQVFSRYGPIRSLSSLPDAYEIIYERPRDAILAYNRVPRGPSLAISISINTIKRKVRNNNNDDFDVKMSRFD